MLLGKSQKVDTTLLQHVSPLGWEHIGPTGDYLWRTDKRVTKGGFHVETTAAGTKDPAPIELILASGDRLRIGAGTDTVTLRAVLGALRERA